MKIKFLPLAMLCLVFASCEKETEIKHTENVQQYLAKIPFASDETLDQYGDNDSVLDYRVARYYAFNELMEILPTVIFEYSDEFNNAINNSSVSVDNFPFSLTDKPVIVYDYDNIPYYYEFGVVYNNEKVISTITVDAVQRSDELIQFIIPTLTYSTVNWDNNRYIGKYPNVYFGKDGQGELLELTEDKGLIPVALDAYQRVNPIQAVKNHIAMMPDLDIEAMNVDLQESLNNGEDVKISSVGEFLNSLDNNTFTSLEKSSQIIPHLYDKEFNVTIEQIDRIKMQTRSTGADCHYILSAYADEDLRKSRWDGSCGPSAMSWVYRGMYTTYNNEYIRIRGDQSTSSAYDVFSGGVYRYTYNDISREDMPTYSGVSDNGLYDQWYQRTSDVTGGQQALYHLGMANGMKEATNDKYGVVFTTSPTKWIRDEEKPVIIMTGSHYVVAIEVMYTESWTGNKNIYFVVHDNGVETSANSYYPIKRKYNSANLHYSISTK